MEAGVFSRHVDTHARIPRSHGTMKKHDSKSPKKRVRIRWDEDNLQYNEENKSATQKIDEPKTPYLPPIELEEVEEGRMSPCALDSDVDMDEQSGQSDRSAERQKERELPESLPVSIPKVSEADEEVEVSRDYSSAFTPPNAEASEWKRRSFEQHRKMHYDEFQVLKKAREEHLFDEDELAGADVDAPVDSDA